MLNWLSIEPRKLKQVDHVDAPFTRLALREKRVRQSEGGRDLPLRHTRFFAGLDEQTEKRIVGMLMGSRPGLARFAGFAGLGLAHLPSL